MDLADQIWRSGRSGGLATLALYLFAASRRIPLPQTIGPLLPPPRFRRRRTGAAATSAQPPRHRRLSSEGTLEGHQLGLPVSGRQQESTHCSATGWGGHLFRRFCNMFSNSSPCLHGQHGSCSTAQQPGNSQNFLYKTFRTSGRLTQYKIRSCKAKS